MGAFDHCRDPDDGRIRHHRTDDLHPRRKPVAHDAAGNRDGGMAGHIEGMGIGIPTLPNAARKLISDGDRLVKIMIGVDRRAAKRGHHQEIDPFEPGLNAPVKLCSEGYRPLQFDRAVTPAFRDTAH